MVRVAALRITTSGARVRVSCGKFSASYTSCAWAEMIVRSVQVPQLLNMNERVHSKQIHLYKGMGFRLQPFQNGFSIDSFLRNAASNQINKPMRNPQPAPFARPSTIGHLPGRIPTSTQSTLTPSFNQSQMVSILLALAKSRTEHREGDIHRIMQLASAEALEIGKRCVQRYLLDTEVSRHVPQSVKIAVAVRDRGQCTYRYANGVRCWQKEELQFDIGFGRSHTVAHRAHGT